MTSRVIMTVGCPGSGKTTFARSLDPEKWLTLSLDDFRAALWGSKKTYHRLVDTDASPDATHAMKTMLHEAYFRVLKAGLVEGWNLCLANTHLTKSSFGRDLGIMRRFEIVPALRVYLIPLDELLRRNALRPDADRCDETYIAGLFAKLHAPDSWWRSWHGPVEIIRSPVNDNREAA